MKVVSLSIITDVTFFQKGEFRGFYRSLIVRDFRWFDVVVVLRCPTEKLYDRLQSRGYSEFKIKENVECEIFGTLLEEARESYRLVFSYLQKFNKNYFSEDIVHELQSETTEQMEENLERICELAGEFKNEHTMEQ